MLALSFAIKPGWDFSLPATVKPHPSAGLVWMDNEPKRTEIIHEGRTLSWAQLNPAPDKYDFSPVRGFLDSARARGRGVLLRLKCSDVRNTTPWGERPSMVPPWVLEKHRPVTVDMAGNRDSAYDNVTIHTVVPWDAGVQAEYLKFVGAFGEAGLASHPALLGLYVHGISTSLGEEFWFDPRAFENLVKAGMTPEKLRGAFGARIKAWARAFGDRRGKLAWVGVGWIPAPDQDWEAYKAVQVSLNRLAVDEGLGYRGGGIERFHDLSDAAGQRLDESGRLIQDWNHPILKEGRYYGDENEIYRKDEPQAPLMYRAATLRALQMGLRFLWVGDEAVSLDPEVSHYFNLTAGKPPDESSDLWCWLLEMKGRKGSRQHVIRNFDRGLIQVEAEGSRTLPALPTGPLKDFSGGRGEGFYAGRSTQATQGQKSIAFRLDPAYPAPGPRLILKVTYVDTGADWRPDYNRGSLEKRPEPIAGTGDGLTKTATLEIDDFRPAQGGSPDLGLLAVKGDLVVSFVRLIR